ncbi:hypothetical protein Fcan01_11224 [Folsomia candida]|uniref:Uncharacterized protein n=1 Tax=Folsomia candida TaxID=158441 RepID=A0A226E9G9_FOLCA|nr:hypothetical protein Fcan01_11224 [Folsomia candida]
MSAPHREPHHKKISASDREPHLRSTNRTAPRTTPANHHTTPRTGPPNQRTTPRTTPAKFKIQRTTPRTTPVWFAVWFGALFFRTNGNSNVVFFDAIYASANLSGVSFPLYFASNSLARKCQGFVFCVMFIILIGACWNYYLDKAQIQMINTCLEYESNILEGAEKPESSTQLKATIVFFHLLKHSYYMGPLAVLGLILFDPCTPPFILSMTTACSELRWTWRYMLIPPLETYIGFCFFYIGTAPLAYNFCAGIRLIPEWCPLLQIGVQYVVITMHGKIAMPVFLIFPVILMDTILNNMLIFTLASWVFNSSVKSVEKLDRTTLKYGRRSIIRRTLKSCGLLKIKFGSNSIDRRTPLVIQNLCLTQTMSIILIKEGRRSILP